MQHGIVSGPQLNEVGLSSRSVSRWVAAGTLHRVGRQSFAVVADPLNWTARVWAAALSAPAEAAVGFLCAGELDGFATAPSSPVDLVMPDTHQPRPWPGVRVHQTCWLPAEDVVVVSGLRRTTPARTVLDAAADASPDRLDQMLHRLLDLRLYDGRAMERVLAQRPGWRGCGPLNAAIGRLDAVAESNRSWLEILLHRLIESSDLPTPANNAMVEGEEVDFSWFGTRAIVEADGRATHHTPSQLAADQRKWAVLEAAGYVILRVTYAQVVYEPKATVERIRAFLRDNAGPPIPSAR